MTVIKNKNIDTAFEIYLALYQGLVNYEDDILDAYREFSPDFFDLITIDECHRGSAADDSKWREILEYFSSATHLGGSLNSKRDFTYKELRQKAKEFLEDRGI
jgi:type I restriction enzyme R subunit